MPGELCDLSERPVLFQVAECSIWITKGYCVSPLQPFETLCARCCKIAWGYVRVRLFDVANLRNIVLEITMDELQRLRRQLLEQEQRIKEQQRLLKEERLRREVAESRVIEQNCTMERMQQLLLMSLEQRKTATDISEQNFKQQTDTSGGTTNRFTIREKHDVQEESLTAVEDVRSLKSVGQGANRCLVTIFSACIWGNALHLRAFQKQIDEGVQLLLKNFSSDCYTLDNEISLGKEENCIVGGKISIVAATAGQGVPKVRMKLGALCGDRKTVSCM